MLNLLEDYIYASLPRRGDFSTNPNLSNKVDGQGNFRPFYGNTTVFLLDDKIKQALGTIQAGLYRAAWSMLAQPLDPATFHMTLHDLVNGPKTDADLLGRMEKAEQGAKKLLESWKQEPEISMKATALFNMVNTSVVLGLAPANSNSMERLDKMYMALEQVVPLGYTMTPHITMAYFKPGTYSQEQLQHLAAALGSVQLEVELNMEKLVLQTFADMNHYENV